MLITLNNLQPKKGNKKRRRVGRGSGSGRGTYSGRGVKGQKARTGGKGGLKVMGLKQTILKLQKQKGMKKQSPTFSVVNIQTLEKRFTSGQTIDKQRLVAEGILDKSVKYVKILGDGKMTKSFTVKAGAFSKTAREKIEKAGGKVLILSAKTEKNAGKKKPASKSKAK